LEFGYWGDLFDAEVGEAFADFEGGGVVGWKNGDSHEVSARSVD